MRGTSALNWLIVAVTFCGYSENLPQCFANASAILPLVEERPCDSSWSSSSSGSSHYDGDEYNPIHGVYDEINDEDCQHHQQDREELWRVHRNRANQDQKSEESIAPSLLEVNEWENDEGDFFYPRCATVKKIGTQTFDGKTISDQKDHGGVLCDTDQRCRDVARQGFCREDNNDKNKNSNDVLLEDCALSCYEQAQEQETQLATDAGTTVIVIVSTTNDANNVEYRVNLQQQNVQVAQVTDEQQVQNILRQVTLQDDFLLGSDDDNMNLQQHLLHEITKQ